MVEPLGDPPGPGRTSLWSRDSFKEVQDLYLVKLDKVVYPLFLTEGRGGFGEKLGSTIVEEIRYVRSHHSSTSTLRNES